MDPHSLVQHAGHVDPLPPTQRTNQAIRGATGISAFGDFLSGKMLRKEESDPFERVKLQKSQQEEGVVANLASAKL